MKLSKLSIPYRATGKLSSVFIIFLFAGGASTSGGFEGLAALAFIIFTGLAAIIVYEYLYWRNYCYELNKDGMEIVSGVFSKKTRDIPLRRIQNVDVERNIVQRFLGIALVHVETAGGDSTEAAIRYVDYEKAKDIQKEVRELKNRRGPLEEPEKTQKEDFRLPAKDLGILSLVSIDSRVLGAYFFLLFFGGSFLRAAFEGTSVSVLGINMGAVIFATLSLLFIWVGSAVSMFTKFYDFRLSFRDNALEYERGLLNRSSGTIPEDKIQNLIIEENFLKRMLGYATLKVETAGYSPSQQQVEGSETAIPLAETRKIKEMAEKVGGYSTPKLNSIGPEARQRYFRRYIMISAALFLTAPVINMFVQTGYLIYILGLLVLIGSRAASRLKWRNIGYYLQDRNIFVQKGFWNRRTYTVPYFRIQNIMESQTVFQERWGMKTVTVDTAGSVRTNPEIIDLEEGKAVKIREEIFSNFKDSIRNS